MVARRTQQLQVTTLRTLRNLTLSPTSGYTNLVVLLFAVGLQRSQPQNETAPKDELNLFGPPQLPCIHQQSLNMLRCVWHFVLVSRCLVLRSMHGFVQKSLSSCWRAPSAMQLF